jgi:predicted dehydrogenase
LINIAVIGAGAFGRNHARVYHELAQAGEPVRLAAVVDPDVNRADDVAQLYGARAFGSVEQLVSTRREVVAASVCVPTHQHLTVTRELIEAGIDVLVEKPVAASLSEVDEMIALARHHDRVVQVGHLERFNPAVVATIPLITHPMFFEVHRLSVFTPRSLDIDVVLDLMIHDLDVVFTFVNSPIKQIHAVGLPILSSKVDIANVRMEFDSGCVANFTASRVSTERIRKLRFFQPRQYVSIDYSRQDALLFSVGRQSEMPAVPTVNEQIHVAKPAIVQQEPLYAELKSFLKAVGEHSQPTVTLQDGRKALAAALDILQAISEHRRRVNLESLALHST